MAGPLPGRHAAILAQKLADGQLALFVQAVLARMTETYDEGQSAEKFGLPAGEIDVVYP